MHLTPTEITFLADSFAKTNPMSPFVNNKKELTGTEAQTLEEKGIFSGGKLTEEAARLLLPLSAPERCARMIVQKPFAMLEKYTYSSAEKLTLAESNGNGLVITPLEGDTQPVLDVMDDFLSGASIKNVDLHLTLYFHSRGMPVSPGASGMQPRDPCRPWRGTLASGHKPR